MRAGARIKPAPATSTPWPISPSSAVPCCACAPLTGRTPPCHNSSSRASTPRSPLSAPLPPNPKTKDHGLTVALALVPEAIAFAFVAGVPPLVGLYAAFFIGLITSVFGGRPGMISGATGALAVVMVALVQEGNARGGE